MRVILVSLIFIISLFAEFKVGDTMESFTLPNQFDNNMTLNSETKVVLMAFEKDMSVEINEYLQTKDKEFLNNNNAIFIADISSMPSFVTSFFALPKMKKYPYSLMLIYDDFGKKFNIKDEMFTVYKLNNLKVEEILYFKDTKNLDSIF
jgi:hypothetical protein